MVDEALDDGAKLVHGVGGGGIFVGEFIDGFCVCAALALEERSRIMRNRRLL